MSSKKRGAKISKPLLMSILKSRKLTITRLAEEIGYNRRSISYAINREYMDNQTLNDIAGYLGVSPEYIKGEGEHKKHWEDSYAYKRLMEILDDYWLSVEDEQLVEIEMHFEKADGQTQDKKLIWRNPNRRSDENSI